MEMRLAWKTLFSVCFKIESTGQLPRSIPVFCYMLLYRFNYIFFLQILMKEGAYVF